MPRLVRHIAPLLALAAASAGAQEPAAAQAPYTLGEVVISAERPVSERAATLRVVSADDIRAAGARTLDEALALVPGLSVRTGGEGVPRLDMRGFRSRHLILLLDGIPLNSTFDGQADPSLIPVEQIAYIKVTGATSSVLYGEGGLGGVVNVVTRRGEGRVSGDAGGELREGSAHLARGTLSGAWRRSSWFASAGTSDREAFPAARLSPTVALSDRALRPNSDRRRTDLFGSLTLAPGAGTELGLVLSSASGAYGIPPTAIADPADPFAQRPAYERVNDLDARSAHVALRWAPAGAASVRATAFVNDYDERRARYDDASYSSMDDPLVRGTFSQRSRSSVRGAELQGALASPRWGRLTLSLSVARDAWESDLLVRDVPLPPASMAGGGGGGGSTEPTRYDVRSVSDERALRRYGIAAEYELRPSARVGLTAGVMRHRLERDAGGSDGATGAVVGAEVEARAGLVVHASAARKFRFPTIRQLYEEGGGNPSLRTERATAYEVGVRQALARGSAVEVTGFLTDARDFIERPAPGEPFANNDVYRFAGVEATAEMHPAAALLLRGGYTYLSAVDRSPEAAGRELQYRPRHRATLDARWSFPVGLDASLALLGVAHQVYYSRQAPYRQAALPGYAIANVRLAQRLLGGRAELYAGVDNLLDHAYEQEYGSPQPLRTGYGGARLRF